MIFFCNVIEFHFKYVPIVAKEIMKLVGGRKREKGGIYGFHSLLWILSSLASLLREGKCVDIKNQQWPHTDSQGGAPPTK
jgi:hypothetical protein